VVRDLGASLDAAAATGQRNRWLALGAVRAMPATDPQSQSQDEERKQEQPGDAS